jgi:hypothetical protein
MLQHSLRMNATCLQNISCMRCVPPFRTKFYSKLFPTYFAVVPVLYAFTSVTIFECFTIPIDAKIRNVQSMVIMKNLASAPRFRRKDHPIRFIKTRLHKRQRFLFLRIST